MSYSPYSLARILPISTAYASDRFHMTGLCFYRYYWDSRIKRIFACDIISSFSTIFTVTHSPLISSHILSSLWSPLHKGQSVELLKLNHSQHSLLSIKYREENHSNISPMICFHFSSKLSSKIEIGS